MQLDEWVDLFAPASSHRYRCKLCDRELFGESRRKHVRCVHKGELRAQCIVITRAKWQTTTSKIEAYRPDRELKRHRANKRALAAARRRQREEQKR